MHVSTFFEVQSMVLAVSNILYCWTRNSNKNYGGTVELHFRMNLEIVDLSRDSV